MNNFDPDKYLEKTLETRDDSRSKSRDKKSKHRSHSKHHHSRSKHHHHHHSDRSRSHRHHSHRHSHHRESSKKNNKTHNSRSPSFDEDEIKRRELDIIADESTRQFRTVFVKQLKRKVEEKELIKFFEQAGKVRKATLIRDKYGRSRGMAYIEMLNSEDVSKALLLDGQKFCTQHPACTCSGLPIVVKPSEAEKNIKAAEAAAALKPEPAKKAPPTKVYVSNLHSRINEDHIKEMFKTFGAIDKVDLQYDDRGYSRGFAFITFDHREDAEKAVEKMDGKDIGGKRIKCTLTSGGQSSWSLDEDDGLQMNSAKRAELMAKIAQNRDSEFAKIALNSAIGVNNSIQTIINPKDIIGNVSNCVLLKNMFNPNEESGVGWENEIKEDVISECETYGSVLHCEVDKNSFGYVYLVMSTPEQGRSVAENLNGRWFAKKMIQAEYIPEGKLMSMFPDCRTAINKAKQETMNQL